MIIRPYSANDRLQVENICLETAGDFASDKSAKQLLLTAFCRYYLDFEPENCFVASSGDTVSGYILCSENTSRWAEVFSKKYIDTCPDERMRMFFKGTMAGPLRFASDYPAHLHIDLLPSCQRQGTGTKLMDCLTSHLKDKGIPAVMLSVDSSNEKGMIFYKKYGFSTLESGSRETLMGLKLS